MASMIEVPSRPASHSIHFFDRQFAQQAAAGDLRLNPFEAAALPYLSGRVLDFGCGLGNLAFAAARQGCSVLALDGSPAAIAHIRAQAAAAGASVQAACADLRDYAFDERFDAIVCIGLLMFFDCARAQATLAALQARVRPGGVAAVNVLTEGTTFLEMFGDDPYCLFARDELLRRFAGWEVLHSQLQEFEATGGRVKTFATLVARKPAGDPFKS
jgi:tellurite methyltransferase